jgi:CarD family transcriptional regulator
MEFSVGDKVIHPGLGAGQITGVEERELLETADRYYVIEIPSAGSTVYVPVSRIDDLGLRPAMSRAKLSRVLTALKDTPGELPDDPKERREHVEEKLKPAHPMLIAELVRDLTWLRHVDHLTKKDQDLLSRGRDFLAGEIALVRDSDIAAAEREIDAALAAGIVTAAQEASPD